MSCVVKVTEGRIRRGRRWGPVESWRSFHVSMLQKEWLRFFSWLASIIQRSILLPSLQLFDLLLWILLYGCSYLPLFLIIFCISLLSHVTFNCNLLWCKFMFINSHDLSSFHSSHFSLTTCIPFSLPSAHLIISFIAILLSYPPYLLYKFITILNFLMSIRN